MTAQEVLVMGVAALLAATVLVKESKDNTLSPLVVRPASWLRFFEAWGVEAGTGSPWECGHDHPGAGADRR
jgi:hypothetical protein